MLLRSRSTSLKPLNFFILRNQCSDNKIISKSTTPPRFITQIAHLLDIDWLRSRDLISAHRKLLSIKFEDIVENARALERLNYTREQYRDHPSLLYTGPVSLYNRHKILEECGCVNITASILSRYIVVMNRQIKIAKLHRLMPEETIVSRKLVESFKDIEITSPPEIDDEQLLKTARETVLNLYLRQRLHMTDVQLKKLWVCYHRIRHKSFESVTQMVNLLTNELNFSVDRIVKNAFVLYGDAANVRRIIDEIKCIGSEDIREVIYRRPKIMMSNCDCVKKTIEHIKSHGIDVNAINKCIDILTLASDTVLERLDDMDTVDEFRALKSNPRILRLVHFQTKARLRLEYLNQMKIKCASLHILSSHTDAFVNYTKYGTDKGKGCDIINYLAKVLNRRNVDVREKISRHSNWCHVPTLAVTQSYEFLISKMFSADDIFENLQILLYPVERIKKKLVNLQTKQCYVELKLSGSNNMTVSNQQMLALCLYMIELEFHFTGDGIWTDQDLHPNTLVTARNDYLQPFLEALKHNFVPPEGKLEKKVVENFNSILPNFPASWQKGYKYGTTIRKLDDKKPVDLSV